MAKGLTAFIQPNLLIWARQYSYLSKEEAAKRIQVPLEKLDSWEKGISYPTVNQLHEVARVYHQPFAFFYLPSPPDLKPIPVKDFRRLPGGEIPDISPELANEIHIAMNRRDIYMDLSQEMGDQIIDYSISLSLYDQPDKVSEIIRNKLDVSIDKQRNWGDNRIAFNEWRECLEKINVLVFQTSQFDPSIARGFSIGEFPLPVIVVNRKDTYTGRIFSLIHEYAHILLKTSGVCEIDPNINLPPEEHQIEVFCNQIAASTLMPSSDFYYEYQNIINLSYESGLTDNKIEKIALRFCVSREAALRRMLSLDLITDSFYKIKREQYLEQYKKIGKTSGFVPPATNVISLAGKPYTRLVLNAFDNNIITSSDISNYLDVRLKHLKAIGERVGVR